jgi:hypothetical protein
MILIAGGIWLIAVQLMLLNITLDRVIKALKGIRPPDLGDIDS